MKAIVYHEYGSPDVLELQDIDKPVAEDSEVLVRIHAASANAGDWHFMRGDPYIFRLQAGLFKPKNNIAGFDLAGQVESVGKNVSQFRPGDEVYADVYGESGGTFAEYMCVSEDLLVLKPTNLTFEQAAAVPMAHRPAGSTRSRADSARAEGVDYWCLGRRWHVRRADRQSVRGGSDRRVQHQKRGHGPVPGRRPCH